MSALHELQRAFAAALLTEASADFEPHVLANGIEPTARIRIYRNNARENFLATLRATFPVLERLVGEDYFRQMTFEYRENFPSASGNLHHLGALLPQFLARRYADTEYRYFTDIARLEWAYQEVLVAADHEPLDLERLRHVAPADYPQLLFRLHPAARLVASVFPVLTIWSANQPHGDCGRVIDLDGGAERVLVLRTARDVELRRLDAPEFEFLSALASGATLAAAADAATNAGAFDLAAALPRYVSAAALVDCKLAHRND